MCIFCWNHINVFLWNHSIFAATTFLIAGTILIICWNHVFCFQAGVALFFLLQPTSGDADGEQRALGNQRSFQVTQAFRSREHGSMALFVFCFLVRVGKGQGRGRKRRRDLTVRYFQVGWLAADRPKVWVGAPAPIVVLEKIACRLHAYIRMSR
ncbi:hypothetical protein ACQJBY_019635 [Aegilops geniculata]